MGVNPSSLVRQIQDGDLLLQVSLVPETRLRYDFPYRSGMPSVVLQSNNPYLSSILHEAVYSDFDHRKTPEDKALQRQVNEGSRQYPPAYTTPYHAATLVEPRLSNVDVTKWTTVISDNDLFKTLLSAYFIYEYPTYPAFQKDIFLQALVEGDTRYCSPLLVNSLLAEACVSVQVALRNRSNYDMFDVKLTIPLSPRSTVIMASITGANSGIR